MGMADNRPETMRVTQEWKRMNDRDDDLTCPWCLQPGGDYQRTYRQHGGRITMRAHGLCLQEMNTSGLPRKDDG